LLVKHENNEWTIDYGSELVAAREPSIGYVVLFGDVPYGVTPLKSGYCVTLTYDLYLDDVEPGRRNRLQVASLGHPMLANELERAFREKFEALLEDPEFLPDGGTLGFGMRHVYPIKDNVKHVHDLLKGSDAIVYRSARALGFEPLLYMHYEWEPPGMDSTEGVLIERLIRPSEYDNPDDEGEVDVTKRLRKEGGIILCAEPDFYRGELGAYDKPETIEWVTPQTTYNELNITIPTTLANEPGGGCVYGDLCLVVRIGKAGERLQYPTSAQLREVWAREDNIRPRNFWLRNDF